LLRSTEAHASARGFAFDQSRLGRGFFFFFIKKKNHGQAVVEHFRVAFIELDQPRLGRGFVFSSKKPRPSRG